MSVIQGDVGGGGGTDATITFSDITTNDVSASKHGFMPKLPNTATKFWRDDGTYQPISGGGDALVANPLSQFATTTPAQLAGVLVGGVTGTGSFVQAAGPTLTTPTLGVAAATSVNKVAITAPATGSTITVADGVTLTVPANANIQGTSSGTNTGDQTVSTMGASGALTDGTGTLLIAQGGTGSTSASAARTALGLAIGTNVQAQDVELAAIAGLTSAADSLPYFTGSGTAALAVFTAAGRAIVDDADAAAQRTTLGLGTAATSASSAFQASDAELTAIAGLVSAADKLPYFTGSGTAALADFTTAGRALVDDADVAAQRTTLGLGTLATQSGTFSGTSSGTNTGDQTNITGNAATVTTNANLTGPVTSSGNATTIADAELAAIAGLTSAADRLPYFTGSGTASLATFTAAARALLDDVDAATMLATLGALALAGGTMSGAIAMGNNNITGAKQVCFNGVVAGGNKTGATQNLADWTAGSLCLITLTGNCTGTSTMTSPTGVSRLTLMINTGGFTISTWPATVKWRGGVAPTLTASGLDIITFIWDGSSYYGDIGKGFA